MVVISFFLFIMRRLRSCIGSVNVVVVGNSSSVVILFKFFQTFFRLNFIIMDELGVVEGNIRKSNR